MKALQVFILFLFFSKLILGQIPAELGKYIPLTHHHGDNTLLYNILYPSNFDSDESYPLLVFLHGAGERGNDNIKQLVHGSNLFLDSIEQYPAIVIFPQCPESDFWAKIERGGNRQFEFIIEGPPNPSLAALINLIDSQLEHLYVDNKKLYVLGLSMGGMGTLELAWRINNKIAAAISICGAGPVQKADQMMDFPFWFFHGVDDKTVPARYSRMMLESIQKVGGKAKITLYPGISHNSWDPAFAEPDFLSWLFSQKRN